MPISQAICRVSSLCRQPEIAEHARDQPAVMVAGQQERRASRGIMFMNRRNIFARQGVMMCRRCRPKPFFLAHCLSKQHTDLEISRDRYRLDRTKVTMIASTMPLLTIHHKTEYRYTHPVAFGEHRIMLRPRDGHDLRVLSGSLEIVPEPMSLRWIHDVFGNSVAIATFDERAETLSITSTATVEHNPARGVRADPGRSGLFLSVSLWRRGVSRSRSVHHAAIWRSRRRAVGLGAGFSRRAKGRRRPSIFSAA